MQNTALAERGKETAEEKPEGSRGWLRKFKKTHPQNIKMQDEEASDDAEGAASYPEDKVASANGFSM
jgi:hypothetical protein